MNLSSQGWILFEQMYVFTGLQFTKHLIESILVETNQLYGSNSNVIFTRQKSLAESKRRALAFSFPVQIWYVFSISKGRGESDLGLCMKFSTYKENAAA